MKNSAKYEVTYYEKVGENNTINFDSKEEALDNIEQNMKGLNCEETYAIYLTAYENETTDIFYVNEKYVAIMKIRPLNDAELQFVEQCNKWIKDKEKLVNGFIAGLLFGEYVSDHPECNDSDGYCTVDELNLDKDDLSENSLQTIEKVVIKFFNKAKHLLLPSHDLEQIGIDLYFNLAGHGTGFWDRDYENATEFDKLVDANKCDICLYYVKETGMLELKINY